MGNINQNNILVDMCFNFSWHAIQEVVIGIIIRHDATSCLNAITLTSISTRLASG